MVLGLSIKGNVKGLIKKHKKLKCLFQHNKQLRLENLDTDNPKEFLREIGQIGVGNERMKPITMEVMAA